MVTAEQILNFKTDIAYTTDYENTLWIFICSVHQRRDYQLIPSESEKLL